MIWNKAYIYKAGIKNGYPKCCIDAYYEDLTKHRSPSSHRQIDHSGYIPCKKHYEEYQEKLRCLKALCDREEKQSRRTKIFQFSISSIDRIGQHIKAFASEKKNQHNNGWQEPGLLEHLLG